MFQAPFAIVRRSARFYHIETLNNIKMTCIILYNIITKDERDNNRSNMNSR